MGFYKQATHRRPSDEPFFLLWGPEFMTGDGPKTVHFGPKMAKHGKIVNVDTALRAKVLANKQMLRSLAFDCS